MADRKGSAGKSGMNVDTALVRELADMLGDTGGALSCADLYSIYFVCHAPVSAKMPTS